MGISPVAPTDWSTFGLAPAAQQSNIGLQTQQGNLLQNQSQLVQQQAQQAAIQTQIQQASLPIALKALQSYGDNQDQSGETPPSTPGSANPQDYAKRTDEDPVLGSWYSPGQIDTQLQQQYAVNPVGTPQEIQAIAQGSRLMATTGNKGFYEAAVQQRNIGVDQRKFTAQQAALGVYNKMGAVSDADEGSALYTLEAVAPNAAARIKDQFKDPEMQEAAAKQYANHVSGAIHMYTGREAEVRTQDGVTVDAITKQPIPGIEKSGMSAEGWTKLATQGIEKHEVKMSNNSTAYIPQYKIDGYPDLESWVMKQARAVGVNIPGANPTLSQSGPSQAARAVIRKVAATQNTTGAAPAPSGAQPAPSGAQPAPSGAQPTVGGAPAVGTYQAPGTAAPNQPGVASQPVAGQLLDYKGQNALADKQYQLATTVPEMVNAPTMGSASTDVNNKIAEVGDARKGLLKEAGSATTDAATTNAYINAARSVLSSPGGMPTGLTNEVGVPLSRALAALHITDGNYAAKQQELAKYLANMAWNNMRTSIPAGSRLNQNEFKAQMEMMNPSAKMQSQSISDMLDNMGQLAQYRKDSGSRVQQFLAKPMGGDPRSFAQWNEDHFPVENAMKPQEPTYKTPEDVRSAFQAGKLTRAQAKQILQTQHGMQ